MFDLNTGATKGSVALPASTLLGQTSLCNDIAVGADGMVYAIDSLAGHILRLKPGGSGFEIWAHDPRWDVKGPQLDGIAVLADGTVYANVFEGDGLYRVVVKPDGSAGTITKLQTSRPLYHSDELRAYGQDKLLMVEGETKGTLDLITVTGDNAQVDTIKDGFEGPVDTGTAFLNMLGVFAEFETNLHRERQLEGIKAAKDRGIYKGRKPSIDAAEVKRL